MFETNLTVIGNVVNDPRRRETSAGDVVTFRVASTARYPGDDGQWRNGGTVFVTVNCWRRLIEGAIAGLKKGAPVIVHGALRTRQYTTADGNPRTDVEMRASAVGLDLARCIAKRIDQNAPSPSAARDRADSVENGAGAGAEGAGAAAGASEPAGAPGGTGTWTSIDPDGPDAHAGGDGAPGLDAGEDHGDADAGAGVEGGAEADAEADAERADEREGELAGV